MYFTYISFCFILFTAVPEETFPIIDKCQLNSSKQIDEETCEVLTNSHGLNITCSIYQFFPDITIHFRHSSNEVDVIASSTWDNIDQTKNKRITIHASPSSNPYTCIVSDFPGPDHGSDVSAKIIVSLDPGDDQKKGTSTSKYI